MFEIEDDSETKLSMAMISEAYIEALLKLADIQFHPMAEDVARRLRLMLPTLGCFQQ
jgi:hypothetical protein